MCDQPPIFPALGGWLTLRSDVVQGVPHMRCSRAGPFFPESPCQPFLRVSSWEELAPRRDASLLTSWILLSGGQIFTPATSHLATVKGAREGKTQPGAALVSPAMGLHSLPCLTQCGLSLQEPLPCSALRKGRGASVCLTVRAVVTVTVPNTQPAVQ